MLVLSDRHRKLDGRFLAPDLVPLVCDEQGDQPEESRCSDLRDALVFAFASDSLVPGILPSTGSISNSYGVSQAHSTMIFMVRAWDSAAPPSWITRSRVGPLTGIAPHVRRRTKNSRRTCGDYCRDVSRPAKTSAR